MADQEKKIVTVQIPFSLRDMAAFSQLLRELRFENRFFLSDVSNKFVAGLIKYATQLKVHHFSAGTRFYRARVHEFKMEESHYNQEQMGPPPPHKTTHGRLNPIGIPYLYLANDIDTAISEVRPWIGCNITVAEFTLNKDISVINFSKKVFTNVPSGNEHAAAETTWRELITFMFSMPFHPRDETAYVATQYFTERIKKEGFDGILYDSALNRDGYNLTLFDHGISACGKLMKVDVQTIHYDNKVSEIPSNP